MTWTGLRDMLLDALEEADFPVSRADLYVPERALDELTEPAVTVCISEEGFSETESGENLCLEKTLTFNVFVLGRAANNAEADELSNLTERLLDWMHPIGDDGARENVLLGDWEIQEPQLLYLYNYDKLCGKNRRWQGLIKVPLRVLD